jgi:hypothetical protein
MYNELYGKKAEQPTFLQAIQYFMLICEPDLTMMPEHEAIFHPIRVASSVK